MSLTFSYLLAFCILGLTRRNIHSNIFNIMRFSSISLLALLIPSLHAAESGAADEVDFDAVDPGTYSDVPYIRHEEGMDSKLYGIYLQRKLTILREATDAASALNAAANLRLLNRRGISEASPAPETEINVLQMKIATEINRLRNEYFHGSSRLAELLNYSDEDAIVPVPLSADHRNLLTSELLHNMSMIIKEHGIQLSGGGPGLDAATAWKLSSTDLRECHAQASLLASESFNDWQWNRHRNEVTDDHCYLVYTIVLICNNTKHEVEQWYDITSAGKVYSEEEQKQAMQQIVERLTRMLEIMTAVTDKPSADKAAEDMTSLIREISDLHKKLETKDKQVSVMENLSPVFDYDAFRAAIKRHLEHDCYGSEALRAFLSSLLGSGE